MARYAIEGGRAGKERLDVLAAVTGPATLALLERAGVRTGQRCVDIGCGGGSVSRELARIVGTRGSVVGIDADGDVLALARDDALADGLANVTFCLADASSIAGGPYDVAYARFVLSHVGDPVAILRAMASSLAPGGVVIVEDTDFSGAFCHPPSQAFDRGMALYRATVRGRGGDPDIGPALPAHMRAAGIDVADASVSQPVALTGAGKRLAMLTQERIRTSVLEQELVGAAELDALERELREYLDDPTTFASAPRIVQAWGHPGGDGGT